eukprot:14757632-Alexandrium_andersonii.AAC.1
MCIRDRRTRVPLRGLGLERPHLHAHGGLRGGRLSEGAVLLQPEPLLHEEEPLLARLKLKR